MFDRQAARIASIVAQRRAELAAGVTSEAADTIASPPLARADIRADADFDVLYRVSTAWRRATAANLSVGGMLMRAHEVLVEGMAVETRFTLPATVLKRAAEHAVPETLWDARVRDAARSMIVRPFKELAIRARVVCHRSVAGAIGDYGMEFCAIDAAARSEISRYCAAFRFAQQDPLVVAL